jgi:hypothetical protein
MSHVAIAEAAPNSAQDAAPTWPQAITFLPATTDRREPADLVAKPSITLGYPQRTGDR